MIEFPLTEANIILITFGNIFYVKNEKYQSRIDKLVK